MHDTAESNSKRFIESYVKLPGMMLDIGSRLVATARTSFCIRHATPDFVKYVGVDFQDGDNVDVVIDDGCKLPFDSESIDYVVSSSCFEHAEHFWLTYLEAMRILKPSGILYVCAPSNGPWHRFPVDCWRFYPDSASALVSWGRKNGLENVLLEQFTSYVLGDVWEDYVFVILKDAKQIGCHPKRILHNFADFKNGSVHPHENFLNVDEGWGFWLRAHDEILRRRR